MTTDKQYKIKLEDVTLLEKSTSGGTKDSAGTILAVGGVILIGAMMVNPSSWMD